MKMQVYLIQGRYPRFLLLFNAFYFMIPGKKKFGMKCLFCDKIKCKFCVGWYIVVRGTEMMYI